jgi:hypothetical protein
MLGTMPQYHVTLAAVHCAWICCSYHMVLLQVPWNYITQPLPYIGHSLTDSTDAPHSTWLISTLYVVLAFKFLSCPRKRTPFQPIHSLPFTLAMQHQLHKQTYPAYYAIHTQFTYSDQ